MLALDDASANDPERIPVGTSVGGYVIEALIGVGGFARVYRARHEVLATKVALKVLTRALAFDPEVMQRFVREAQAASRIQHASIVRVLGFGTHDDGRAYQVLELVDGPALDTYLEDHGRLPVGEALDLLASIADAVDAAHALGIVHRDLKPANILLAPSERRHHPRLTDFGIAKALGDDDNPKLTRTGLTLGTPAYMSPEQALGVAVGPASDVYAFGVMTFELLTGQVPFDAESPFAMMIKHVQETPPLVSSIAPALGRGFDDAVRWMLAKQPEDRPATLGDAVRALQTRSSRRRPRRSLAIGGFGALVATVVVLVVVRDNGTTDEAVRPVPPTTGQPMTTPTRESVLPVKAPPPVDTTPPKIVPPAQKPDRQTPQIRRKPNPATHDPDAPEVPVDYPAD